MDSFLAPICYPGVQYVRTECSNEGHLVFTKYRDVRDYNIHRIGIVKTSALKRQQWSRSLIDLPITKVFEYITPPTALLSLVKIFTKSVIKTIVDGELHREVGPWFHGVNTLSSPKIIQDFYITDPGYMSVSIHTVVSKTLCREAN